jgi:acetyl esterase/lipase
MKLALSLLLLTSIAFAAETPAKKAEAPAKKAPAKKVYPQNPPKTVADFKYGPHERNVLDFWQAKSDKPTPLLFYIHGGGWMGGDKKGIAVEPFLKPQGISVVSINYRYISQAQDVVPPVKAPLHDAALALQTVRSRAAEWNIDKTRIGASGGSAGACSAACGWPSILTWPIRRVKTPSPASPPASTDRRREWSRRPRLIPSR